MIDINELRNDAKTAHYGHLPLEVPGSEMLELLDRLEAAEKAVTEAYQRGFETGQEEIEKERDALCAEANTWRRLAESYWAKIEQME